MQYPTLLACDRHPVWGPVALPVTSLSFHLPRHMVSGRIGVNW